MIEYCELVVGTDAILRAPFWYSVKFRPLTKSVIEKLRKAIANAREIAKSPNEFFHVSTYGTVFVPKQYLEKYKDTDQRLLAKLIRRELEQQVEMAE